MVTRKLGHNCTTFSSHVPICHCRNTLSSGPKSLHCVAAPTLMNTAAAPLPSCRRGGKCGLGFQNNEDNKASIFSGMLLFQNWLQIHSHMEKMSPFSLTIYKKKQKAARKTDGNLSDGPPRLPSPGRDYELTWR